jgi:serine/threonine-protein kinase
MDAAHRHDLVHRDLKPENIFLLTDGPHETAKVLDFGVARVLNESRDMLTDVGALVGSLRYMAPAQLRGDDVQAESDLWALGIIAYEMLTGSHPFARFPMTDLSAIPVDPAMALACPLADAPARWTAFFRRVLALETEGRPSTAATLLTEFEYALADVAG